MTPWEKFEWLILSSQDLHWIKCFHYFHNFYIYMSFSILYSWVTQEKQIERAIHNISNSIFYQSRNPYLWLELVHLAERWFFQPEMECCQGASRGDSGLVGWQIENSHWEPTGCSAWTITDDLGKASLFSSENVERQCLPKQDVKSKVKLEHTHRPLWNSN